MHLKIKSPDGTLTAYFGLSDFTIVENGVEIAFHSDVSLPPEEKYRLESGRVVSAISESGYNFAGAVETIGALAIQDYTEVVIGATARYPHITNAATDLENASNFDGDLKIIQ